MKNIIKNSIITLLLLIFAFTAISCGKDDGENAEVKPVYTVEDVHGRQIVHTTYIENIAEYTVIRPDIASDTVKSLASQVRTSISEYVGEQLKINTDLGSNSTYEILIGETSRSESKKAMELLDINDYVIKLDGTRIVIAGGSEEALETAVNEFLDNFMFDDMVVVPNGDGLLYLVNYKFDSISIDGKDISEYKVYSSNPDASVLFANNVLSVYSGQTVAVADSMEEDGSYIVLEPASMDYVSYKAELRDGNLYVSGSYKSCTDFLDYYVKKGEKKVNIKGSIEGKLDAPVLYTKDQLMAVMQRAYDEEPIIIGEQTNIKEYPSDVLRMFYEATGTYPGMIGIDVGGYGMDLTGGNCSEERKSQIFCELVEYAEQGGIIQIHTHMAKPSRAWEEGDEATFRSSLGAEDIWEELLTEGTELNEAFRADMKAEAEYIKYFHDIGVPVLWRPFHEMNANWFWWGISQDGKTLDGSYFTRLWIYMYEYYEELAIDSLIWVYSPNNANGWIDTMYCYPGDEYVDIVGLDWYTDGGYEINDSKKSYAQLMNTEKITNICEFGINGALESDDYDMQKDTFSCLDFEALMRQMLSDGFKVGYILTWTAQDSVHWWGYGEEMMENGLFLDRDTLREYFEEAKAQ